MATPAMSRSHGETRAGSSLVPCPGYAEAIDQKYLGSIGGIARRQGLKLPSQHVAEAVLRSKSVRENLARRLLTTVCLLGLATLTALCIRLPARQGDPPDPLSLLTVGRPIEARLPGLIDYEICRRNSEPERLLPRVVCGAVSDRRSKRRKLLQLRPQVPDADPAAGADQRRARGRYLLNWAADVQSASLALESFESALGERPADPALRLEVAASLTWRAHLEDNPADLFRALDLVLTTAAAEEATTLFNRALVLSDLGLRSAATASWDAFLGTEPLTSPWRQEGLERRRELVETTAERDNTEHFESWRSVLEAAAADPDPMLALARAMPQLEVLAATLKDQAGDQLAAEATAQFTNLANHRHRQRLRDLLHAHWLFLEGWNAYQRHELEKAAPSLQEARADFIELGSPWQHWADFYLACAEHQQERFSRSSRRLDRLANATASQAYPYLQGHIAWVRGANDYILGRPLEAAERFLEAHTYFESADARENAALLKVLLGESRLLVGDEVDGWRWLYRGLRESSSVQQPRRRLSYYGPLVELAAARGQTGSALFFQHLESDAARELANPRLEFFTLLSEAQRLLAAGRATDADALLRHLHDLAERLDGESRHLALAAWVVASVESHLATGGKVEGASLRGLDESITTLNRLSYGTRRVNQALETRSRVREQLGDFAGAVADLTRSWEIYRAALSSASPSEVWSLHREASAALKRRVALLADRPSEAFIAAEEAHSFGLGATGLASLRLSELEDRLPVGVTMLHLSRIGEEVYAWTIERGRSSFFVADLPDRLLHALLRSLDSSAGSAESERRLYDALLSPLEGWMTTDNAVVVIVEPQLAAIPFSALRSPAGKRWIETRSSSTAPSATAFLRALTAAGARTHDEPRVLVLSDPLPSSTWRHLPPLQRTRSEGAAIAGLYRHVVHLHGAAATRANLVQAAEQAGIIHIATHAVSNTVRPEVSFLALSPDRDAGALYYPEIHRLRLRRAPLIILSACDTAAIPNNGARGASSLAHAFLAAGASAVIGTRRPVDDAAAEAFAVALHRRLAVGAPLSAALRETQLDSIRDRVDGWSAFELIGALGVAN